MPIIANFPTGDSAYQRAVEAGFTGTEDEFYEQLAQANNLVTVLSGGNITMDETIGAGPYAIEFTEESDGSLTPDDIGAAKKDLTNVQSKSITANMIADNVLTQLGAFLAISAAATYNPDGSYAVGDYCTHGGKLHKCNTAIPDGEAWNEEHWTETTVAAELAEVRASLSNKVSRAGELVPLGTNILTLAPGRYSVDGVPDTDMANSMNLPVTTWHYEIDVIAAANATGLVSNYKVIIVYPSSNVVLPYINIMNYEGKWTGWTRISTATPPQEQNLMLSSGWNIKQGGHAMFFKTQENVVHVIMSICSNAAVSAGDVIATIPVGFRPAKLIQIPIICKISGQSELKFGHLDFGYDGTFRIYDAVSGTESVTEMAISPFSFLAAN